MWLSLFWHAQLSDFPLSFSTIWDCLNLNPHVIHKARRQRHCRKHSSQGALVHLQLGLKVWGFFATMGTEYQSLGLSATLVQAGISHQMLWLNFVHLDLHGSQDDKSEIAPNFPMRTTIRSTFVFEISQQLVGFIAVRFGSDIQGLWRMNLESTVNRFQQCEVKQNHSWIVIQPSKYVFIRICKYMELLRTDRLTFPIVPSLSSILVNDNTPQKLRTPVCTLCLWAC